ncbi:glycosyltransferase family 2 protein [Actinokineospora terrae]|uniref:4,4'-diaponeurosporenoate glycosyltransferase n=1 Tax=Actinokineospora terrae TaxID=155974 RepID=A0A1H9WZ35_9PSEU|nr:glycosyltransferase [Actinokineospora terrae]SES39182.1 Glycosyl transferase family 2 [Actinokineospora terrae]
MRVDVVVPARDEGALVGAGVRSVFAGSAGLDVRVIVVANGCTDDTAERAREAGATVVEVAGEGKAAALNVGLARCRDGAVVFLDADTVLLPGTLARMAAAMDAPEPRLVGPRPLVVRPTGWLARSFSAVWTRLPAVTGDVVGAGCYAINAAGRALVPRFPDVVADDAWVRMQFRERIVAGEFLLVFPEGRELVDVVRRWRDGNAALPEAPSAGAGQNLGFVLRNPALWLRLPGFMAVLALGRRQRGWARSEGVRVAGRMAPGYTFLTEGTPVEGAYERLYALASRFPGAGVYGGGVSGDVRFGKPRGAALVETRLWERIGRPSGLGELWVRARAAGATPMVLPLGAGRAEPPPNPA